MPDHYNVEDTPFCTGTSQGLSCALVVPLLMVISETKDLINPLVWAVLKVEGRKM